MANSKIPRSTIIQSQQDSLPLIPKTIPGLLCVGYTIALVILPGCGSSNNSLGRLPISGMVVISKSSTPVSGTISFLPKEKGPAATAQIQEGTYQFTQQNGPIAGEYRVLISTKPGTNPPNASADPDETNAVLSKVNSTEWTFSRVILPESKVLKPFVLETTAVSSK